MKKTLLVTLNAVAVFSILFAIGCSSNSSPVGTSNGTTIDNQLSAFISDNTSTTDDNAALFRDSDPMGCDNSQFGEGGRRGKGHHGGGPNGGGHRGGDKKPRPQTKFDSLRLVLDCLTLTTEQNTAVRQVLDDLHTQVGKIMQAARIDQEPLRAEAKAKAKVILDGVKAGTTTRADAKIQLDAIRIALNESLKPGRDARGPVVHEIGDLWHG